MKYDVITESVQGKCKHNEDCFGVKSYGDDILVALADGMGSTDCAKDAAELTVETILNTFDSTKPITETLYQSIMLANDNITKACIARGCKMGCAIAVVYVRENQLWYVTLGNVRIYMHAGDVKECINKDDVYIASNGNRFLTRSISGKDLQGKVEIKEHSMESISSISLETDGYYYQDEEDDATVIRIVV